MNNSTNSTITAKQKLQKRLKSMKQQRTRRPPQTKTQNRRLTSKKQKKLQKKVQRQGADAIMKQLGVTDPSVKQMIMQAVQSGDITDGHELIQKISQMMAERDVQSLETRDKIKDSNISIQPILTLPGALN